MRRAIFCFLFVAAGAVVADDSTRDANAGASATGPSAPQGDVKMSGMSILGNDEAPKSLVLVPWKSSQLGDMPALSKLPDDSIKPVDKDVFARELSYYQIRSNSK